MIHNIFGIRIDDVSDLELEMLTRQWLESNKPHFVVTPNPEMILLASRSGSFKKLLNKSDLSLPDGVGLKYAIAALSDFRLVNRHTGVDYVELLIRLASNQNKHMCFFGGDNGSAESMKNIYTNKFSNTAFFCSSPIIEGDADGVSIPVDVTEDLKNIQPDILFVALGQGKQERFINEILNQIPNLKIAVGVGGAFETLIGKRPRANRLMRNLGLEWLWRLLIEPRRYKRIYRAVIVFPMIVVWGTLKQHCFWKAVWKVVVGIWDLE